jgi:Mn-dependent DtxR family transcriptional regulator
MGRRSQYPVKRQEVVRAIFSLTQELHRTPSVREIAGRTGVSLATLHSYLENLAEEGLIEWRPKRHRSLRLTPKGQELATTDVPF